MNTTATTPSSMTTVTMTRRDRVALGLLVSAQFLVMLDTSIVNVALPSIQSELGFGPAAVTWVVNAYVLAFAGLLLLSGRAADLFGRRRVFVVGASLFTVGTLLAAVAVTKELLILGPRRAGDRCRRPESGGHVPAARHLPGGPTRPGDGGMGGRVDAGWSHRRRARGSARRHRGLAGRVPGDRAGVPGRRCPGPARAGGGCAGCPAYRRLGGRRRCHRGGDHPRARCCRRRRPRLDVPAGRRPVRRLRRS